MWRGWEGNNDSPQTELGRDLCYAEFVRFMRMEPLSMKVNNPFALLVRTWLHRVRHTRLFDGIL